MTIGPYEVLEELGPGPHGARRVVACISGGQPVLLSLGTPRGGNLERERYVRLGARLQQLESPYVAQLYEHTETYLALELVEEPTWERSLASFPNLLEGVAAAHRAGVVHTELRPAWILGGGKVDFTPVLQAGEEPDLLELLPYMAPEQTNAGAGEDPRVDIYALGVLLHEVVTGQRPFEGNNPIEIIDRILRAPVPENSSIPLALDRVIRKALSKEPEARFATVDEFLREFKHHQDVELLEVTGEPVTVAPPRKAGKPFFQSLGVPRIASSDWLEDED